MGGLRAWAFLGAVVVLGGVGCGDDSNGSPDGSQDGATVAVCGNGIVEEGEDCDNGPGANIDGSGCDSDCTYSCTEDAQCNDGNPCNGEERCSTSLHRCQAGTALPDGTSCTLMLPAPSGGNDGGVEDGGVNEDPELIETPAVCLSGHCGRPCDSDEDCNDGNPCNGEETCNFDYDIHGCQPGEAPDCDDGLECTIDSCDPEENPETGCVHTLIDEDGDGYAPFEPDDVECDGRGGDCDDSNPDIHPGADRICGDGIDNNCLGTSSDEGNEPIWYRDCDGDGYAAAAADPTPGCLKPPTTEQCLDWTQLVPTNPTNTDCDDSNPNVHPGARNSTNDGWYTKPYCRGFNREALGSANNFHCDGYGGYGALSWDWDCDGDWSRRYTNVNYDSSSACWQSVIIYPISLEDDEGHAEPTESASTSDATLKSSLMSEAEPTGGLIQCCFCWCSNGGGGWHNSWAPGCGSTATWRTCNGCTAPCLNDCSCTSSTSSRMQECR